MITNLFQAVFWGFLLLIISPIFFSQKVFASAFWYVDNMATGANSGTSWQDAWKSTPDINFSLIKNGDTLYISGGNSVKTYTGTITVPAGTTGITITKGNVSGHNGEVIFDGQNSTTRGISISAQGTPVKNLIISNLTFKNYTNSGVYGSGENSGGLQGITVNNCRFLDFKRAGVFFEGNNNVNNNYNITVKNSYFDDDNSGTSQSDGIYVQKIKDFTAYKNHIILDNNYTGTADLHSDNIQSFWVDNILYSNNIIVQKSDKTLGTQMLFTENGYGEHVFLNNVIIRDAPNAQDSALRLKTGGDSTFKAKVIGNTYYGRTGRMLNSSVATVVKNNIFFSIDKGDVFHSNSEVSNNIISSGGNINPNFVNAGFTNPDFHLQTGSPAINAGADLSSLGTVFTNDIEGKKRDSSWDIGAYEFGSADSPTTILTQSPPLSSVSAGKAGDANSDSKVDGVDYVIWLNNYNKNVTGGKSTGDFDGNGFIDGVDYVIWLNNYGK